MIFKNKKQSLSPQELENFKSEFSLKLPSDYEEHIMKSNGGKPERSYFKAKRINYFHPIKHGEFGTLERTITRLKDILPKNFFPFAYDGGGNQFCISLKENEFGKVYFCPMDVGEIFPELLTDSFKEFIESLTQDNNY